MIKVSLVIRGKSYEISNTCVKNWDEIKVSFKRNDYDGVIRTFSDKFEFVSDARKLLLAEFNDNYLQSSANVVVCTRNNSWTYNEQFSCSLDFSTMQDDGFVLSINAIDNSFASKIKAKRSTTFEYRVNELKEDAQLYYDGIEVDNNTKWIDGGTKDEEGEWAKIELSSGAQRRTFDFPLYIEGDEILVKNKVEINDVPLGMIETNTPPTPFFVANKNLSVSASVQFSCKAETSTLLFLSLRVYEKDTTSPQRVLQDFHFFENGEVRTVNYSATIELKEDERLCFVVTNEQSQEDVHLYVKEFEIKTSFVERIDPINIDLITPTKLLNRLLKSINGEQDGITGIIKTGDARVNNAMIIAAESVRQIEQAKIHTSFSKFADWMKAAFGYVYSIEGNVVTFQHRNELFGKEVVKKIENYADYSMSIEKSIIYSKITAGYEKKEYKNTNGRYEFNSKTEYTTDNTLNDAELTLISPYRGDAYGIEFLVDETLGKTTTDNKSDNDVFFVGAVYMPRHRYELDRSVEVSGISSNKSIFNAMYSPSSFIIANETFIAATCQDVIFASSEGNSSVIIDGQTENRNIELWNRLFSCQEITITTPEIEIPEEINGLIEFEHKGNLIRGYYKQVDYNYGKSKSQNITMIVL